ncbi:MAG: IS30 family transposase [Bacilli bacterium]
MNTINIYKKHLTLTQRIKIENGLNNNKSFRKISLDIDKAHNTISREVLQRRTKVKGNSFNTLIMECPKTKKAPFVCNGCPNQKKCRYNKYFYYAKEAFDNYKFTLVDSRMGIDLNCDEFHSLDKLVKSSVDKGHSFSLILMNNPDINISKRTLYHYSEKGYLTSKNIDLPRKVRYKKRKRTVDKKFRNEDSCRKGRTYEDFNNYMEINKLTYYTQMDTVEGIKGHSILLTLFIVPFKLLLAYKLDGQTVEQVNNKIFELKSNLGYELFHNIFPIILTDNGKEFKRPLPIENNGNDVIDTKLFYCEPRRSDQKGSIEVCHEYIRRYIEQGKDLDKYTNEDIALMINHINNTKRESLDSETPYQLLLKKIGDENTKKLGLYYINPNDVILKPSLFNKNK